MSDNVVQGKKVSVEEENVIKTLTPAKQQVTIWNLFDGSQKSLT